MLLSQRDSRAGHVLQNRLHSALCKTTRSHPHINGLFCTFSSPITYKSKRNLGTLPRAVIIACRRIRPSILTTPKTSTTPSSTQLNSTDSTDNNSSTDTSESTSSIKTSINSINSHLHSSNDESNDSNNNDEIPIAEHRIFGLQLDLSTATSNSNAMKRMKYAKFDTTRNAAFYEPWIAEVLTAVSLTKRDLVNNHALEWRDLRVIYDMHSHDAHKVEGTTPSMDTTINGVVNGGNVNINGIGDGNGGSSGIPSGVSAALPYNAEQDVPGTKYSRPHFFVRKDCFLIKLIEITALVTATECYLFNNPNLEMQKDFLAMMAVLCYDDIKGDHHRSQLAVQSAAVNAVQATFDKINTAIDNNNNGDNNNVNTVNASSGTNIDGARGSNVAGSKKPNVVKKLQEDVPFEFNCLEAVLKASVVRQRIRCDQFRKQTDELITLLRGLTSSSNDSYDVLYGSEYGMNVTKLKSDLANLTYQTESLVDAIKELLQEDEEMANMCLTWKHKLGYKHNPPNSMHEEVEEILENYLWQYQEILHDLKLFSAQMMLHEYEMGLLLDSQRNQIMKINLKLTIWTFGMACAGVGAGLFGMNLHSGVEEIPYLFWVAIIGLGGVVPSITWRILALRLKMLKVLL